MRIDNPKRVMISSSWRGRVGWCCGWSGGFPPLVQEWRRLNFRNIPDQVNHTRFKQFLTFPSAKIEKHVFISDACFEAFFIFSQNA
jgi:hypothetical protein